MYNLGASVPLDITIVGSGFYKGFNATVAITTKLLVVAIVIFLLAAPDTSVNVLEFLKTLTLSVFAVWYNYLLAAFVVFCGILAAIPASARITLGVDGAVPEHSTVAWLSMMFCSGIGIGILVFSVSEPVSHFLSNPDILDGSVDAGSTEAMFSALRFVFLHWGFSAWACYAVVALALGLACHRFGQPMTMRSAIAPLFGKRMEGAVGHTVDVLSLLAIIAGITTTIVLGIEQICSGLFALTGNPFFSDPTGNPTLSALLTALFVAIGVVVASIISGQNRGVKWMSQLGISLAFGVLLVFILFGGGLRVIDVLAGSTQEYIRNLPTQILSVYSPSASETSAAQRDWQNEWTIFYWAWWIAFAPFVGMFLARISYGRTIREFILGAMLAPTIMCFVWFAGTGGSALILEVEGPADGAILLAEHAARIYSAADVMLGDVPAYLFKIVLVVMFLVLIVTSTTAAIIAIKSIGAAGSDHAETTTHSMLWAGVIAANAGAVMAIGGVHSIRDVMIVGAVPFSIVMALMLASVARMIFVASRVATR